MNAKRIYVAAPYTRGDPVANTRAAIDAGTRLLEQGHAPLVPHLNLTWHLVHAQTWQTWLDWCVRWVEVSDAVLRLPGESAGADVEVLHALQHDVPVFVTWDELQAWLASGGE